MKKPTLTLGERRDKILEVAATDYHSSDDAAQDYLGILEGANVDEQKLLFRLLLQAHGARRQRGHKCPPPNSIKPKEYHAIAERVGEMARSLARAAARNNASLEETADSIWDELTLCEGNDRVVALAILLQQGAIPYAQLPGNLTVVKPLDVYADARDRILGKVAQLNRVAHLDGVSPLELSAAFAKIIEQIESCEERTAFVEYFLRLVTREVSKAARGHDLSGLLGGLLGEIILEFRHGHEDEDEEDI